MENHSIFEQPYNKPHRWFGFIAVLSLAVGSTAAIYGLRQYLRQPLPSLTAGEQASALTSTEFIGKVQPAMSFKIAALSPGIVREIHVQVGDRVKANQPLLVLENPDVVQAYNQLREQQATVQQQVQQLQAKLSLSVQSTALLSRANQANHRFASAQLRSDLVPLRQRQDSVARAQAAYDLASAQLNRTSMLYREGVVSQAELDRVRADLSIASADLQSAQEAAETSQTLEQNQEEQLTLSQNVSLVEQRQQQIDLQNQLQVAQLQYEQITQRLETLQQQWVRLTGSSERNHFQMVVRATGDGVVAKIPVSRGDQILTGTALVELSQIEQLNIEVEVSARLVNSLSVGQLASAQVGMGPNAQAVSARVVTINPLPSDDLSHTIKLQFDNPEYQLLVGQPAKIRFEGEQLTLNRESR